MQSSVVSLNAGASLGSLLELEHFILTLDSSHPSWSLCFISELHASECVDSVFALGSCRIHVHHPGVGARAMCWIVRNSMLSNVSDVVWLGRTGAVRLKSWNRHRKCAVVVGIHGSHTDLFSSFSEVSCQLAGACRRSSAIVGDFNVDMLSLSACDPYAYLCDRDQHHSFKRSILQHLMDSCGLEFCEPVCDHSKCEPFISGLVQFSNATRVPIGEQCSHVSCIDFACASPHFFTDGMID